MAKWKENWYEMFTEREKEMGKSPFSDLVDEKKEAIEEKLHELVQLQKKTAQHLENLENFFHDHYFIGAQQNDETWIFTLAKER